MIYLISVLGGLVLGIILQASVLSKFKEGSNDQTSNNDKKEPGLDRDMPLSYFERDLLKMSEDQYDRFLKRLEDNGVSPAEIESVKEVYNDFIPIVDKRIKTVNDTIQQVEQIPEGYPVPDHIKQNCEESSGVHIETRDDLLKYLRDLKESDDRRWAHLKEFVKKMDYSGEITFKDDRKDYPHKDVRSLTKHRDNSESKKERQQNSEL